MACETQYAEAYQYAQQWCKPILTGLDDSGLAGNGFLTASYYNFEELGVESGRGFLLINTTDDTEGYISAVTATKITASPVVNFDDGDGFRIELITPAERSAIVNHLKMATMHINGALQASGQCDCAFSTEGYGYLQYLNYMLAGVLYQCPCAAPNMDEREREIVLNFITEEIDKIRSGEIAVCSGATGSQYPYFQVAEQSWTSFNEARIIINRLKREG